MKLIILAAAVIATSSIPLFQTSLARETKPNFIITIADDHGVYHSSVYGSPEFNTPHLEALAGGDVPTEIDGKSFAPVLFGESDHHRDRVFATHKGDKSHNVYPIRSVRLGDWKYILNLNPNFTYTTHTDLYGKDHPHGGHHWHSYVKAAESDPRAAAFLMDYHGNPARGTLQSRRRSP